MSYFGREPRLDNTTLTPRTSEPTPALEGMIYRNNGTGTIPAGIYEFRGGSWQPLIGGVAVSTDSNAVSYTPIIQSSFGTPTEVFFFYRKEGDYLVGYGSFRAGTTNSTGSASFSLPVLNGAQLLVDYSKLTTLANFAVVGSGLRNAASSRIGTVQDYLQSVFVDGADQTNIYISTNWGSSVLQKQPASSLAINSNDRVNYNFRVPIVGWSSSNPYVALNNVQFNTDEKLLTFKATAIVSGDPVGTFNTYTYAATSNTPTISGTAPTQTTTGMALNGILLTGRAYSAAFTTSAPSYKNTVPKTITVLRHHS